MGTHRRKADVRGGVVGLAALSWLLSAAPSPGQGVGRRRLAVKGRPWLLPFLLPAPHNMLLRRRTAKAGSESHGICAGQGTPDLILSPGGGGARRVRSEPKKLNWLVGTRRE